MEVNVTCKRCGTAASYHIRPPEAGEKLSAYQASQEFQNCKLPIPHGGNCVCTDAIVSLPNADPVIMAAKQADRPKDGKGIVPDDKERHDMGAQ